MGVSVEDKRVINRIDGLRQTAAHIKFLSLEPLLGPLENLDLSDIDRVIVGGESGRKPRPMEEAWVLDIAPSPKRLWRVGDRQQCKRKKVDFFFKQWGGVNPGSGPGQAQKAGRVLQGRTYDAMPAVA